MKTDKMKYFLPLALLASVCSLGKASPINVFSTGNGSTTDGTVDPHWTYTNASSTTANAFVANNPGVDFWNGSCCGGGPWLADSSSSAWIVNNTGGAASGGNPLSFQTTFSLAGLDPSTASISLAWGVDDGGNLLLNGSVVDSLAGQNASNWQGPLKTLNLTTGFLAGSNTLKVVLTSNDNSFEGARVQINSATANPLGAVPEPSTILLAAMGLGAFALSRRLKLSRI